MLSIYNIDISGSPPVTIGGISASSYVVYTGIRLKPHHTHHRLRPNKVLVSWHKQQGAQASMPAPAGPLSDRWRRHSHAQELAPGRVLPACPEPCAATRQKGAQSESGGLRAILQHLAPNSTRTNSPGQTCLMAVMRGTTSCSGHAAFPSGTF